MASTRHYRETWFRRARTFVANAVIETVAATGRLHPAASPSRHGVEVVRDVAYGPDPKRVRLFRVALDGKSFDHLTSRSCGGLRGSGLGTAPSA